MSGQFFFTKVRLRPQTVHVSRSQVQGLIPPMLTISALSQSIHEFTPASLLDGPD